MTWFEVKEKKTKLKFTCPKFCNSWIKLQRYIVIVYTTEVTELAVDHMSYVTYINQGLWIEHNTCNLSRLILLND